MRSAGHPPHASDAAPQTIDHAACKMQPMQWGRHHTLFVRHGFMQHAPCVTRRGATTQTPLRGCLCARSLDHRSSRVAMDAVAGGGSLIVGRQVSERAQRPAAALRRLRHKRRVSTRAHARTHTRAPHARTRTHTHGGRRRGGGWIRGRPGGFLGSKKLGDGCGLTVPAEIRTGPSAAGAAAFRESGGADQCRRGECYGEEGEAGT